MSILCCRGSGRISLNSIRSDSLAGDPGFIKRTKTLLELVLGWMVGDYSPVIRY